MANRLVFFLLGVATGVTAMALMIRTEKFKETEDFEAVADTLQRRFEKLEEQLGVQG